MEFLSAIIGFILSMVGTVFPQQKPIVYQPAQIAVATASATPIATPTATLVMSTQALLPTRTVTPTPIPSPARDQEKWDECGNVSMPIYLFSGDACYPKSNYSVGQVADYNSNGGFSSHQDFEKAVIDRNSKEVRERLMNQCMKVSKGDFIRCNDSVVANGGRFENEMSKGMESEVNACISSLSPGQDPRRAQTEAYLKRYKLKAKLELIYEYCSSHAGSVNDLHF